MRLESFYWRISGIIACFVGLTLSFWWALWEVTVGIILCVALGVLTIKTSTAKAYPQVPDQAVLTERNSQGILDLQYRMLKVEAWQEMHAKDENDSMISLSNRLTHLETMDDAIWKLTIAIAIAVFLMVIKGVTQSMKNIRFGNGKEEQD